MVVKGEKTRRFYIESPQYRHFKMNHDKHAPCVEIQSTATFNAIAITSGHHLFGLLDEVLHS